jgi:hypothetical protein
MSNNKKQVQLSPYGGEDVLDLNGQDYNARQFYIKAVEPSSIKFGGTVHELPIFREIIYDQVERFHWNNIIYIEDNDDIPQSIIYNSELLTLENVIKHANKYQESIDRRTQNAHMMYYYIIDSLEPAMKATLMEQSHKFTLHGRRNGPMLLKLLFDITDPSGIY